MQNFSATTKTGRLLTALQSGEALSEATISKQFGLKNPSATISKIRANGFAVYANREKNSTGGKTTKYRLGKPSRAIVAAGYRAIALGL